MSRKPRHVFVSPQRLLGRNATHPAVVDYTTNSFFALETMNNARGGVSIIVPEAESGIGFLNTPAESSSASASASASATGAKSPSAAATTAPTPIAVLGEGGAPPPGGAGGFAFSAEEIVSMMLGHGACRARHKAG